jgi:malonyl-CoA/methylmalonyl-CoA synthetase
MLLTSHQCSKLGNELSKAISSTSNPHFKSIALKPLIWKTPLSPGEIILSQDHLIDYHGSGLVIFTSGTTGPPKGAVKPRTYLDASAQRTADLNGIGRDDVVMHGLPVHHATGIGTTLMPFLLAGACVEFHSGGFDPAKVWERWRRGGITFYSGVPTIYMRLMRYYETDISKLPVDLQSKYVEGARKIKVLMCGTSALPGSLQQKWAVVAGKRILERYGATEFSSCFSIHPRDVMNCPDVSTSTRVRLTVLMAT